MDAEKLKSNRVVCMTPGAFCEDCPCAYCTRVRRQRKQAKYEAAKRWRKPVRRMKRAGKRSWSTRKAEIHAAATARRFAKLAPQTGAA